ncbi:MAG TPA: CrcB family protein [Micromonosporaceae bacterium]|jgi:CrcB protein|nr:CrcB family protein [Micromonosporaceae bacterium]
MSTARVLAAVAAGGALGSAARYGIGLVWPATPGGFDWPTFTANAIGCGLIGVLMVLVTEVQVGHPLLRPFLGTGVLGGFTTFSTYAVGVTSLVGAGQPMVAAGYLVGTVVTAMVATWCGMTATRLVLAPTAEYAGQEA